MAIFQAHTAFVEPLSLDEAYLDVTAGVHDLEEAAQLAREIKQQIRSTTELTASAGVSYCKFLAKLASDAHKPDGLTIISPEQATAFLDALSIEKFFGVGKVTAAKLRELGIEHGADLKRLGEERLRALLGKHGSQLYRFVRGEDDRPVEPRRERKSVGKEVTFERDLVDRDRMEGVLEHLAGQVEHLYWLLRSSVQKRASKRALAVPVLCNLLTRQVVIWFLYACSLPGFWNRYTK